jgi:hypothetical protein
MNIELVAGSNCNLQQNNSNFEHNATTLSTRRISLLLYPVKFTEPEHIQETVKTGYDCKLYRFFVVLVLSNCQAQLLSIVFDV